MSEQSSGDVVVIEHETLDRFANIVVMVVPVAVGINAFARLGRLLRLRTDLPAP